MKYKWEGLFVLLLLLRTFDTMAENDISSNLDKKINEQEQKSESFMLSNISRPDTTPGVVVASPSTSNPNYFFHWVRDAALTMNTVVQLYEKNPLKRGPFKKLLSDYVTFSRVNQITPNLSGGLGEPKFNVDGSAFNDPWGRPQSDGPALRSIALIHFAHVLLEEGQGLYVRTYLYDRLNPTASIIKEDLGYIVQNWKNPCFDVWEETQGHHFYTMMVQRRALIEGASLAQALGDDQNSRIYTQSAQAIAEALQDFWDSKKKIILESLNQVSTHDKSGLDTAVLLGVLHGYTHDGFFAATNDKVLSTAMALNSIFGKIYPINKNSKTVNMIGRYAEDTYNGDGDSEGNPWFITTLAFAELCYRAIGEYTQSGKVTVTTNNKSFLNFILGKKRLSQGMVIKKKRALFNLLITGLKKKGDAFMARLLTYSGKDGSLSEEINRNTGQMQGAENLTWSHASFISTDMLREAISL